MHYLIAALIALSSPTFAVDTEVKEDEQQSSEFWPADMVPHPHIPGSGPRKNEPDLC
jgi:hypothetical protein